MSPHLSSPYLELTDDDAGYSSSSSFHPTLSQQGSSCTLSSTVSCRAVEQVSND